MDNQLVEGWNQFWAAIPNSAAVGNVLAIIGGAIVAFFIGKWLWQKSRGGGNNGGNALQGFPWWPAGFGLLLTAPNFLIPLALSFVQMMFGLVSQGLEFIVNLF